MGPRLLMISLVTILSPGAGRAAEPSKKELAKLDGTWTLVRMEIEGRSLLEKDKPRPRLIIKDGKATFDAKDAPQDAPKNKPVLLAKVLDPSKKPKTVTFTYEGKLTFYGIYEVAGDELRVCGDGVDPADEKDPEARRPKKFDSKEGLLLVFRREKK